MTRITTTQLRQNDTHRLIPSKYVDGDASVLTRIADDEAHLQDIFALDHATNPRLIGENDLLPGIGIRELVFDVPNYRIINASFCHPHPLGSRFNSPGRGAWYAAFDVETSQAEVAFHKSVELQEINWFQQSVSYTDYLSDFGGSFHDLREGKQFEAYLDPSSYVASQALAEELVAAGASGLVFPSVRQRAGTCLVCFRPAMVANVRRARRYRFVWSGSPEVHIMEESSYADPAASHDEKKASVPKLHAVRAGAGSRERPTTTS